MRVGRFLVVIETVFASAAGDATRMLDFQPPAAKIEGMNAVVANSPVPQCQNQCQL